MYGKLGDACKAREWFDKSKERDLVLFNAMLQVYVDQEDWARVHEVFSMMSAKEVIPDHITFKLFFKALLMQGSIKEALTIYVEHLHLARNAFFEGNFREMFHWLQVCQKKFLKNLNSYSEECEAFAKLHKELSADALSVFPGLQNTLNTAAIN